MGTNVLPQGRKLEKLDIATNLPKALAQNQFQSQYEIPQ